MTIKPIFDPDKLKRFWGSSIVAQSEIKHFTGGAISYSTLANERNLGKAPKGFLLNGRRVYDIDEILEWIVNKLG